MSLLANIAKKVLRPPRDVAIAALGGKTVGVRCAIVREGQYCLVRHTYAKGWHHPGGAVDWREAPEAAAAREAAEETGLTVLDNLRLVAAYRHTLNIADDYVFCYAAETAGEAVANSHEIAECAWFYPDDLPDTATQRTRWLIELVEAAKSFD